MFAVLATVVAAAAHTLAGGGAPSPLFCAVVAALAVPGATALAGARPALWRTTLAVGGSQLLFHLLFAATGDLGAWDASAAHVHGAPVVVAATAAPAAGTAGTAMTAWHLLAAAVTIAAVHRGERAVRAVAQWLPRLLPRVVVEDARTPVHSAPRPVPVAVPALRPRRSIGAVSRRGPPVLFAPTLPA